MNAKVSRTYTIAVTKTVVIDTDANSFEEACTQTDKDLLSGLYQEQWAKARNRIELIQVENCNA